MSRDNDRREGEGLNSVRIRVEAGLEVVQRAVDLMNNNQFMKAEELLKPRWVGHGVVVVPRSLLSGYVVILFLLHITHPVLLHRNLN